jgi:hypothetical protein
MVEAWGGPVLADSARTAIEKIIAALPADRRLAVEQTRLYAPNFHVDAAAMARLESVRGAIGERRGVDRIAALAALERRYPDQPGRRLADFLDAMRSS